MSLVGAICAAPLVLNPLSTPDPRRCRGLPCGRAFRRLRSDYRIAMAHGFKPWIAKPIGREKGGFEFGIRLRRGHGNWGTALAPVLEQELSDCRGLGQSDSSVEGVESLPQFSELLQQVGANGPIGLIVRYGSEFNFIQCCEACTGSFCFGKGGSVSGAR